MVMAEPYRAYYNTNKVYQMTTLRFNNENTGEWWSHKSHRRYHTGGRYNAPEAFKAYTQDKTMMVAQTKANTVYLRHIK